MTALVASLAGGAVLGLATAASASPTKAGQRSAALATASVTPYANAVDEAHGQGLRVWIEVDLSKAWQKSPAAFEKAVDQTAYLAQRPGVVGFKIADELGYYDGLDSVDEIQRFLKASASALRAKAPGRKILVDMVVPQIGCVPGHASKMTPYCLAREGKEYPHLTMENVDKYLASGNIDVVDLATHLGTDSQYRKWGITANEAQSAAWSEVHRRGWSSKVEMRGRKALADKMPYRGTAAQADAVLTTYVDVPTQMGAKAVDIWAWRRVSQGRLVRLMDPGNTPNDLWRELVRRHDSGVVMSTHFSPFSTEKGVREDLKMISTAFTDVLIAGGTG
jgi:hypothetical protein